MDRKGLKLYRHFPLWFRYTQCDELAAFLEEQAAKGWRFRGFRLGLEFERAEPEKLCYDVQVFSKNTEMDTRPEPATEEFAHYCNAAGWDFVDSFRKFTVFRRIKEDAVPIYTAEEKYEAVAKAEMGYFWCWMLLAALWVGQLVLQFRMNSSIVLFGGNQLILAYCIWFFEALTAMFRLPSILAWKIRQKRNLEETGTVDCRGNRIPTFILESRRVLYLILLFVLLAGSKKTAGMWFIAISVLLFSFALLWFRPGREANWFVQMIWGTVIFVVIICIAVSAAVTTEDEAKEMSGQGSLELSDIVEEPGEEFMPYYSFSKTVFGSREEYRCTYNTPGYRDAMAEWYRDHSKEYMGDEGELYIHYAIYDSPYSWPLDTVADREYDRIYKIFGDDMQNVKADWDAEWAYCYKTIRRTSSGGSYSYNYIVRTDGAFLTLSVYDPLDAGQISVIKERLGL